MGFAVLILAALVAAVAVAVFQYQRRKQRVAAVVALGAQIGFRFTVRDDDGIITLPFALFRRGDGRGIELVLTGEHNGLPLRLFDFWYYDETRDSEGRTSRTYHRFTCAIATLPVASPHVRLGHEGFFSKLGSHMGLHDVELEYDAFNQRFRVKCDDQKFAFSLLDGQMMEWLLGHDVFDTVEINGPYVLLALHRLDPAEWLQLGAWLEAFHSHVPAVVFSTYPSG